MSNRLDDMVQFVFQRLAVAQKQVKVNHRNAAKDCLIPVLRAGDLVSAAERLDSGFSSLLLSFVTISTRGHSYETDLFPISSSRLP